MVVQNALAYESKHVSHRLLAGYIFIPEKQEYIGHAAIEIPTMQGGLLIDPTRIGKQFLEQGFSKDEIKHNILHQDRTFYELIDFDVKGAAIPSFSAYLQNSASKKFTRSLFR
jgi:hypothetical protein